MLLDPIHRGSSGGDDDDESLHRTTMAAGVAETSQPASGQQRRPPFAQHRHVNLVTKDSAPNSTQTQAHKSLSSRFLDTGSRLLAKRFPKLADFDQVALLLAGFMCISTFLIALIAIVCTCCCSGASSSKRTQGRGAASASSSTATVKQHGGGNWFMRLFCCCFASKTPVTPIQALMLHQDDDNSTASSSAGDAVSSGRGGDGGPNGKTKLLSASRLAGHMDAGRLVRGASKSNTVHERRSLGSHLGPLDHEASMRIHKRAHELNKRDSAPGIVGYFLGMPTRNEAKRSQGRRRGRWASEMDLDEPNSQFVCRSGGKMRHKFADGGWLSDSCDSDKSCSPGANKNNRYNISDAHKAYLAGKQIQASMFVTTHSGEPAMPAGLAASGHRASAGGRRMGLLKTIDSPAQQQQQQQHFQPGYMDYFGGCNLSDKSTDDSRTPLDRSTPQHRDITNGNAALHINRFISMSSKFPLIGRPASAATSSFAGPPQRTAKGRLDGQESRHLLQVGVPANNQQRLELATSGDLVPISAEEEWPEPYGEPPPPPPEEELFSVHDNRASQSSDNAVRRPHHHYDQRQQHQQQRFNSIDNHHCQDRHIEVDYIQQPQIVSEHLMTNRSYDEAYLANWRAIGRNPSHSAAQGHHHRPSLGGTGGQPRMGAPPETGARMRT